MSTVAGLVPDLMDRSKVQTAARALGAEVALVSSPGQLAEAAAGAAVVVVDLSRDGALDVLGDLAAPSIGFGPHVDTAALDAALEAGCDEVLPRSTFFRGLERILGAHVG